MKRLIAAGLALLLLTGLLAACGQKNDAPEETTGLTAEDRTARYAEAINNCGAEAVEYNPPITTPGGDSELIFQTLGVTEEDMSSYAISMSLMNVQAYTIALIMPAEGTAGTVLDAVNGYVEQQQKNFELYLADQYEIAKNAKVETLDDGTIVLVMAENAGDIYTAVTDALK